MKEPVPEYGAIPPLADTFIIVVPPLQLISPWVVLAINSNG